MQHLQIGLIRVGLLAELLLLSSCASLKQPEPVNPVQQNLLVTCPELSKHEGTNGVMVLNTLIRWASEYNECAARHNALVDVVTNKKEQ